VVGAVGSDPIDLEVPVPGSAILPSQKNEILRLLTEQGFSLTEFQWEEGPVPGEDGRLPIKVIHHPSGFFCGFSAERSGSGKPYTQIEYSPSDEGFIKRESVNSAYAWSMVVGKWVDILRKEIDTPDLWATISSGNSSLMQATTTASENTPFTAQELVQVVLFLGKIRAHIQTNSGLSPDKLNIVVEKLSYLEQAANRLGRKDWQILFLGVLTTMAMQGGMTKNVFHELFSVADILFRQFLQHIIQLPVLH
jgi:hypothetical protein